MSDRLLFDSIVVVADQVRFLSPASFIGQRVTSRVPSLRALASVALFVRNQHHRYSASLLSHLNMSRVENIDMDTTVSPTSPVSSPKALNGSIEGHPQYHFYDGSLTFEVRSSLCANRPLATLLSHIA